jgi:hypothetical protein
MFSIHILLLGSQEEDGRKGRGSTSQYPATHGSCVKGTRMGRGEGDGRRRVGVRQEERGKNHLRRYKHGHIYNMLALEQDPSPVRYTVTNPINCEFSSFDLPNYGHEFRSVVKKCLPAVQIINSLETRMRSLQPVEAHFGTARHKFNSQLQFEGIVDSTRLKGWQ